MSELSNISFSTGTIILLAVTCIILGVMPFAFWIYWKLKHKETTTFKYILAGAIGFVVSARVLELGVHLLCIVFDNPVSRFINSHDYAYVIYGIVMAGVFEECGRYFILRVIMKRNKTRENSIMYGIGHGGIEVLVVTLPAYVLYVVIAIAFSTMDIDSVSKLLNITSDTVSQALPTIKAIESTNVLSCLLAILERFLCMFIHIGLTVIVFYGVENKKVRYLFFAILLHMNVDLFPAMFQRNLIPMWLTEVWLGVWTIVIMIFAVKLYKKSKPKIEDIIKEPEGV